MATAAPAHSPDQAKALAAALARRINGEVRFDDGARALYATDGSNYRQVPIGVVLPKCTEDVIATVALCREYGMPVLSRGGGTSLAGQCCNTAVILDFSKYMNRVLDLDTAGRSAVVEPGCILDHLRARAERHNLTFGPDPATHDHNTLGGMIGNNSCGIHSVMAGRTADNVEALEILTYDGLRMWVSRTSDEEYARIQREGGRRAEIYRRLRELAGAHAEEIRTRYPDIPRRVSGYNLDELLPENGFDLAKALVGSEGTLVIVLKAKLRLVHSPPCRALAVLGFEDVYSAADQVPRILEHGPVGLEGMDERLIAFMRDKHLHEQYLDLLPQGNGWLLAEVGADSRDEAGAKAAAIVEAARALPAFRDARTLGDPGEQAHLWKIREAGLAATARTDDGKTDTWPGWEDSAVHPKDIGRYMRDLRALLQKYDYGCAFYGHFGDGCLHTRIDFDLRSREGIQRFRSYIGEAAELVLRYGGSYSGEHGDGQARAELLPKLYGEALMDAFRQFKGIWDPQGKMNPGKVVDPYPITANLRMDPATYQPPQLETYFSFAEDGSFHRAASRCVGVGVCRRTESGGGVMCPSFLATREERDTTRGRARMLFEMVHGSPLEDGWRSKAVHESLSLCLACKGCKRDCPVSVDMATYKAEFNAHYYRRRLRPRAAYSMGLVYYAARAAAHLPGLANFLTHAPGLGRAVKWLGGIAQAREVTPFSRQTFRQWFEQRSPRNGGGERVLLWPDTFNNHFRPEVARAALQVLESAGYEVILPARQFCCGRPLYAWGMLDLAKRQLHDALETLRPEIEAGTPVVGLEPACVASFRDELPALYPDEPLAARLAEQTFLLGDFLLGRGYRPPRLGGQALVHVHCHQHAVLGAQADQKLLEAMAVDYRMLDSGCCGMAGSFGFEAKNYDLSMTRAEQGLLPAVRAADDEVLLISNGFSCHEQARQGADRPLLHMAQVLAQAEQRGAHARAPR